MPPLCALGFLGAFRAPPDQLPLQAPGWRGQELSSRHQSHPRGRAETPAPPQGQGWGPSAGRGKPLGPQVGRQTEGESPRRRRGEQAAEGDRVQSRAWGLGERAARRRGRALFRAALAPRGPGCRILPQRRGRPHHGVLTQHLSAHPEASFPDHRPFNLADVSHRLTPLPPSPPLPSLGSNSYLPCPCPSWTPNSTPGREEGSGRPGGGSLHCQVWGPGPLRRPHQP